MAAIGYVASTNPAAAHSKLLFSTTLQLFTPGRESGEYDTICGQYVTRIVGNNFIVSSTAIITTISVAARRTND
jgi:hypothetical protein